MRIGISYSAMIDRKTLGLRIREARNAAGLSQQQLAAAVGVSDKTISAYEVGRVDPPLEALDHISQATAHPIIFFLGGEETNLEAKLEKIALELQAVKRALQEARKYAEKRKGGWGDPLVSEVLPPTGLPISFRSLSSSTGQNPEKVVSYASPAKSSSLWRGPAPSAPSSVEER